MPSRYGYARIALALFMVLFLASSSLPQASATPLDDGFALALHGRPNLILGRDLPLVGVAYAVRGLAQLTPAPGATVEVILEERRTRGRGYVLVARASTRAQRDGAFNLAVEVPERALRAPRLRVRVSRGQAAPREYQLSVNQRANITLELLSDRRRYEPGETIHTFLRARATDTGEVRPGLNLHFVARKPNGQDIIAQDVTTSAAGVALLDIPLPANSADGQYAIGVTLTQPVSATANLSVQVARRTVERLLVTAEIDAGPFGPSAPVRGHVTVRAPSGSPVRNAQVTVTVGSLAAVSYTTDAEGVANLRFNAPAFISGDVQWIPVQVRVAHPAHGALSTSTRFLVSRVPFLIEARAENAALVPEVESRIYLSVSRPGGGPAPEGMTLEVSGDAVVGGSARLTLDANGLASVRARLAPNDAGPDSEGGFATDLDIELGDGYPFHANVTVPVAMEAQLRPRARRVVIAPGEDLWIDVERRSAVSRAPVLLTLFGGGRPLAFATIPAGQRAGKIRVPGAAAGVLTVLARPLTNPNYDVNLRSHGEALMGVGASDAVLARPHDAFRAELSSSQQTYSVGGSADIRLRRTPLPLDQGAVRSRSRDASTPQAAPSRAYAAIVARDLAAHGGEQDFALTWMNTAVDLAEADPSLPASRLLLRASLTTRVAQDSRPERPGPIDPDPWYTGDDGGTSSGSRGAMLDPIQARERLLRSELSQTMIALEHVVAALDGESDSRRGIVIDRGGRRDFDPAVIQNLVAARRLSNSPVNLGHRPLTLAMVRSADASFRFDTVARRVARRKLLKLLLAVAALSDADNDDAARVARAEPPARWLAALLNLGLLERTDLLDPWGHAFVLRRAANGRPRFPVAASAPDMEVVSPGPDGRAGTADDVRDPFARVVTQGTLYAVASGEDAAMRSISSLAPGPDALSAMTLAFDTLGLAAAEETRGDAAYASASEGMGGMMGDMNAESFGVGGLGLRGTGRGGGGSSYGALGVARRAARPPSIRTGSARVIETVGHGAGVLARAGEHIRERFPATLFFLGEVALDDDVTHVEIPLADALTTYRVEAISWTASGFTTNARVEIQVQQDATVDAPVPPYANVGDELHIPIRVQNHTASPMEVLVELSAEGISATPGAPISLTIPAQDAIARSVTLRLDTPGEGALVARVVSAGDSSPLDAVRRPLTIYPEARLVREERRLLFRSDVTLEFDVPEDAIERGPGQIYLTAGEEVFGDLYGASNLGGAWVLAALGRDLPPGFATRGTAALMTRWRIGQERVRAGADDAALAFSLAYLDTEAGDDLLRAALSAISTTLERHPEESGTALRNRLDRRAAVLMLLAPAYQRQARPALREDLDRLMHRLTRLVRERALGVTDYPSTIARAAAALAMVGDREAAEELAVRARRQLVQFGARAILEPASAAGVPTARVEPTALLAITEAKLGHEDAAMRLLRSLLVDPASVAQVSSAPRRYAALAAGLLGPPPTGVLTVEVDGESVEMTHDSGVFTASLVGLGQPGTHRLRLRMGDGTIALGRLELRYARPWTSAPARPARLGLRVDGQVGARDTRSGLRLTVQNESPRMMARPVVEVDLPAGVELDEATRRRLGRITRTQPSVEGRTLHLELRPLPPQSRVQIPLPLRFAVSGALRGLGVVAYDGSAQARDGARPMTLLVPRTLEVADEGPPPDQVEDELPMPRPPPPLPPIQVLRRTLEAQR